MKFFLVITIVKIGQKFVKIREFIPEMGLFLKFLSFFSDSVIEFSKRGLGKGFKENPVVEGRESWGPH